MQTTQIQGNNNNRNTTILIVLLVCLTGLTTYRPYRMLIRKASLQYSLHIISTPNDSVTIYR